MRASSEWWSDSTVNQIVDEFFLPLKQNHSSSLRYLLVYRGLLSVDKLVSFLSCVMDLSLYVCGCWFLAVTISSKERVLALRVGGADTRGADVNRQCSSEKNPIRFYDPAHTVCFSPFIRVIWKQNWSRSAIKHHHAVFFFLFQSFKYIPKLFESTQTLIVSEWIGLTSWFSLELEFVQFVLTPVFL